MTLTDLIPTAAARRPDAHAVIGVDQRLSWADLETATGWLASTLVDGGIVPGDRVAVACLKDVLSYVAVHGILRAGAVVVPVDPLAPPGVAGQLLRDADASAVVGDPRTVGLLDGEIADASLVVTPGELGVDEWLDMPAPSVELPRVQPDDPAYIIYTSGSTGRPKGIVHTHASAMAYAARAVAAHRLTADDRVAGIPPLHFDQSTLELYAAPLAGAAVVPMSEAHARFPASLVQRSEAERVSVWYSVPSLFRQLVDRGGVRERDLSALRLVIYGGEVYPPGALRELVDALPHASVVNTYGPAEINECTNQPIRTDVQFDDHDVAIGRPWPDVDVRVVDLDGADLPTGSQGELLVSAPTMMQGYWRQPELTDRSISVVDDSRWYATGDLVVLDEDGVLWFHGRRDNQIKVRGVRVELEAVEQVVGDAPGVAEAVVGPTGDGDVLEAVVVAAADSIVDLDAIRSHCVDRLAQVAVPRVVHQRNDLPRTPSGKIDRAAVRRELLSGAEGAEVVP